MKFVDQVLVQAQAGDGGAGACHFRREKFVPHGGPDGGDGGDGGSIYVKATHSKRTLLDFQFQPLWKAKRGGSGSGQKKSGKSGADLTLEVPLGTEVYRLTHSKDGEDPYELIADLTEEGSRVCIAKGGMGGRGNTHFKSSTNQAPTYAQTGTKGEQGKFKLSLKLIADIGLVGLPNAGKSTLLSTISKAKPKVGDYPFTTLEPMLGLVQGPGGASCVVADIPGLIEGASSGKGLGTTFLKHIERTRIIAHVIDCSPLSFNPENTSIISEQRAVIENELLAYSKILAEKPRFYIFSKQDLIPTEWSLGDLLAAAHLPKTTPATLISSATKSGITECITSFFKALQKSGN